MQSVLLFGPPAVCAVPQFVLEQAIAEGRGGEVKVLCTQPRRLTTIGKHHARLLCIPATCCLEAECAPDGQSGLLSA